MQHAAGADVVLQIWIGRVQRAGNDAVLFAFAFLAQIDDRDVGAAAQRDGLGGRQRPAFARDVLLVQADMHIGRHRDVHHFRVRQFQVVHQLGIFIHRLHLEPRIEQLLLADGRNGVALIVVRGKDQRRVGQLQQLVEDANRIARADRRSGNRCGRCRGSTAYRR